MDRQKDSGNLEKEGEKMIDPVVYDVRVEHWQDGTVSVEVHGVSSSPYDRKSIAWALRKAAHSVEHDNPIHVEDPEKLI